MKYTLIALFILLITACNRKSKTDANLNIEKIKINLNDTSLKCIEDIADTMHIVSLKTEKNFHISRVYDLLFSEKSIIIADHITGWILIFDTKGNLVKKISHRPDKKKFRSITEVFYDDEEKLIEILDRTASQIYRYDEDGIIKDTLSLADTKAWGYQFVNVKNKYATILLNSNRNRKAIGIYVKDENVLRYKSEQLSAIPYLKYLDFRNPHPLEAYRDSIYYLPILDNKIYNLSNEQASPVYLLDYPQKNRLTTEIKEKPPTKDPYAYFRIMVSAKIPYNNSSLFINDNWVTFSCNFQSKISPRNIFYSKRTKKVLQFSALKSKKDNSVLPYANIVGKYKEDFVIFAEVPKKIKEDTDIFKGQYKLLFFKLKNI
jgi:hypothetical protein